MQVACFLYDCGPSQLSLRTVGEGPVFGMPVDRCSRGATRKGKVGACSSRCSRLIAVFAVLFAPQLGKLQTLFPTSSSAPPYSRNVQNPIPDFPTLSHTLTVAPKRPKKTAPKIDGDRLSNCGKLR